MFAAWRAAAGNHVIMTCLAVTCVLVCGRGVGVCLCKTLSLHRHEEMQNDLL